MHAEAQLSDLELSISRFVDLWMFYAILILFGIGITMVTSTTVEMAYKDYTDAFFYVKKQLVFALVGMSCIFVVTRRGK